MTDVLGELQPIQSNRRAHQPYGGVLRPVETAKFQGAAPTKTPIKAVRGGAGTIAGPANAGWSKDIVHFQTLEVPLVEAVLSSFEVRDPAQVVFPLEQAIREANLASTRARARAWLQDLRNAVPDFRAPHQSESPWGEIVWEWWSGERKITIYFGTDGTVTALKVWGDDIETEMQDLQLERPANLATLWSWLAA